MQLVILHRLLLAALILFFFAGILHQHIPFAGTRRVVYTSDALAGSIGRLRPLDRISQETLSDGLRIDRMIEDPVYLDFKTLVPYDTARMSVRYRNESPYVLSGGMNLDQTGWKIERRDLTYEKQENGWTIGSAEFSLANVSRRKDAYQFLLTAPGLRYENREGSILISSIQLDLSRRPLVWEDIMLVFNHVLKKL